MKKIQFANKELPGLSHDELLKMTYKSLHFESIKPMALEAYMNSDYFHSEEHIKSLSRGGVASSEVNKERGNIGGIDSKMARYKKAVKAKERAKLLITLPEFFFPAEAKKRFTGKQWYNITETDLVIKTDKKGGYHNSASYYKLNNEAIQKALNTSTDSDYYFNSETK